MEKSKIVFTYLIGILSRDVRFTICPISLAKKFVASLICFSFSSLDQFNSSPMISTMAGNAVTIQLNKIELNFEKKQQKFMLK